MNDHQGSEIAEHRDGLPVAGSGSIEQTVYASGVQRDMRMQRYFGSDRDLFSAAVEAFLYRLSEDYARAGWKLAELSNGGVYVFPCRDEFYRLRMPGQHHVIEVGADLLGLMASMLAVDWLCQIHPESQWGAACASNACALQCFIAEHTLYPDVQPFLASYLPSAAYRLTLH